MKSKAKLFCFSHKSPFPFFWWGDGKLYARWKENKEKVFFRIILFPNEKLK